MTVQEFYNAIEGNYEEVVLKYKNDKRIIRYLQVFLKSQSMSDLKTAMESGDYEKAFLTIHNMKGTTANMCFTKLYDMCFVLTDELRGGVCTGNAVEHYKEILEEYRKYEEMIPLLQEDFE